MALRRIGGECLTKIPKFLKEHPWIEIGRVPDAPLKFQAKFTVPATYDSVPTPYAGAVIVAEITCNSMYPSEPPQLAFLNPHVYHPKIHEDGTYYCANFSDIWEVKANQLIQSIVWEAFLTFTTICTTDNDASKEYETNRELFERKAKEFVEHHATPEVAASLYRGESIPPSP